MLKIVLDIETDYDQYLFLLNRNLKSIVGDVFAFNVEGGLEPYMNLLTLALIKGKEEDFENGVELMEIIVNATDEANLEPYGYRLLGLLCRTLNYRRDALVKAKMIDLIDFLQDLTQAKAYG